jgi:L-fucose mutarotase
MLIGIPSSIGPDLLSLLYRMGHGDELVLADAFFCGETFGKRVLRADGLRIPELLDGILGLVNLDDFVPDPLVMMEPKPGDHLDPDVETRYRSSIHHRWPDAPPIARMERFAFYERARNAFAVVMTGETVKYGNIILRKGVIPVPAPLNKDLP